jgi:hypothetical protein
MSLTILNVCSLFKKNHREDKKTKQYTPPAPAAYGGFRVLRTGPKGPSRACCRMSLDNLASS